jgi:hypothetical protein
MIRQGEMVNTSPHNVDTMVDKQPIVLSDQGQEVREHTTRPQPPGPAPSSKTFHSSAHDHDFRRVMPSQGWSIWGI